jgi:sec-independent protein translocase protein TatA
MQITMHTTPLLAAFGIGGTELLIILGIALLFFGGSKLPSLAKGLGQSVKEFKKATKDEDNDSAPSAKKDDSKKE